jgi:hypothetical protein
MTSRPSLVGPALRDASSRVNIRTRRQSLGGAALVAKETPVKDRRALLEDWRRQTKNDEAIAQHKREREDVENTQYIAFASTEGTTALERYRMRKQQKLLQQNTDESSFSRPPLLPSTRSCIASNDDEDTSDYSRALSTINISTGTPSFSRRLGGTAGGARRRSFSVGGHQSREGASQDSRDSDRK